MKFEENGENPLCTLSLTLGEQLGIPTRSATRPSACDSWLHVRKLQVKGEAE